MAYTVTPLLLIATLALPFCWRLARAPLSAPDPRRFRLMLVFAAAFFILLSFARHRAGLSAMFDLGLHEQIIHATAQGDWFRSSVYNGSYLGNHLAFVFLLLVPCYALFPSPYTLLLLQALALAGGALAVRALGARLASPAAGELLAYAYLLYPPLHYVLLFDLHAIAFFIPALLAFAAAWVARRHAAALAWFILALACREEAGLCAAALAAVFALARGETRGRRLLALCFAGTGLAYTVIALKWLMPAFADVLVPLCRYDYLGTSLPAIATNFFLAPQRWLPRLLTTHNLTYLALLLLPLALLPLRAPRLFFAAAVPLGYSMLSTMTAQASIATHHVAPVIPLLFVAAAGACAAAPARARAILATALCGSVLFGPLPLGLRFWLPDPAAQDRYRVTTLADDYAGRVARLLHHVPADASVSTDNRTGAHLAGRRTLYHFPTPFERDRYVIWLARPFPPGLQPDFVLYNADEIDLSPADFARYLGSYRFIAAAPPLALYARR